MVLKIFDFIVNGGEATGGPPIGPALGPLGVNIMSVVATINQETGEYLLSGMGELHLEIALKDLERDHRLDVTATEPTVVYREAIQHAVGPFMGKSPNKHNRIWFEIEPLEPAIVELIKNGELSELSSRRQREMALREKAGWNVRDSRRVVSVGQNANLFTDFTSGLTPKPPCFSVCKEICDGEMIMRSP